MYIYGLSSKAWRWLGVNTLTKTAYDWWLCSWRTHVSKLLNLIQHIDGLMQETSLQWRHNVRGGVSNHQPHDCIYSTVYSGADQRKHQSSASLAFVWVNSPMTGEFPAQRASNAENVSIWWRHHGNSSTSTRGPRDNECVPCRVKRKSNRANRVTGLPFDYGHFMLCL